MSALRGILLGIIGIAVAGAALSNGGSKLQIDDALVKTKKETVNPTTDESKNLETATFAGGCFWCVEAVYQRIKGVEEVVSGYIGGHVPSPTYQQICSGNTGHAEAIQIKFDPAVISYDQLLDVFWRAHDPTTLNRQGADVGTQYRSAIFYHSEAQKEAAEASKKQTDESDLYPDPIVTEISEASIFYQAEDYHQNYFNENRRQGYCQVVIWPKLKKLGLPVE